MALFVSRCLLILAAISLVPEALASSASGRQLPYLRLVPDSLISLSAEPGTAHAIFVEKATQTLTVYEFTDMLFLKHRFPCSTGEVSGKKQQSGDRKTPEGVYFFTKAFAEKELAPIYGSRAFVMDYPNFADRKFKRGGDNIWLHGSDKPIKPRDSNGCIVMNNDDLEVLARYIQLNRTPITVVEKLNLVPPQSQRSGKESLMGFLNVWKWAMVNEDWRRFRACYGKPYGDPDVLRRAWDRMGKARQHAEVPFSMSLRNMTLLGANADVVALFDEVICLGQQVTAMGTKKLFLEKQEGAWKILGEEYQPCDQDHDGDTPLIAAINNMHRLYVDRQALTELVAEWADAWSSKDIGRYRACYASDFQAGGRDLDAWIRDKERLNTRYDSIRVSIEDLKIELKPQQSTATFLQRYYATGYQAVGIKELQLKRIGETWKIHRENWESLPE
jgi:murein L,D-transpeptidase YafK